MYEIYLIEENDSLFYEDGGYGKMDVARGNFPCDRLANAEPASSNNS